MKSIKIVSVNVAGLRGATITGKAAKINCGFDKWFNKEKPDLVGFQETKVTPNDKDYYEALKKLNINTNDFILQPDKFKKGHAGVAIWVNKKKFNIIKVSVPFENHPDAEDLWFSGRWIEIKLQHKNTNREFIFINSYFHHADSPTSKSRNGAIIDRKKSEKSMYSKHIFMSLITKRLRKLIKEKNEVILVGDINIAHKNIDIKNYNNNKTKAGFLPEERAWLDLFFAPKNADLTTQEKIYSYNKDIDYKPPKTNEFKKGGLGLVDISRKQWGNDAIYTWWTNMGKAFDNDSGWRIDYQIATSNIAQLAKNVKVYKQESYAKRYSDHAPLVVEYKF